MSIKNNVKRISFNEIKAKLGNYSQEERKIISKAYHFANQAHKNQFRSSGAPFIQHPLHVSLILIDMNMDYHTICAGLLHDVLEDTDTDRETIQKEFGSTVGQLVDGVTKFRGLNIQSAKQKRSESMRKMLLAMVQDLRVILIKFADRLHNMRTLKFLDENRQKRIATETMDIFAPLAGRLGMQRFKVELEDLSLRYIHPDLYQNLKSFMAQKKIDRENMLNRAKEEISLKLKQENLNFEIKSRIKNFYSIYQKMNRFKKSFDDIYDYQGVRLIVEDVSICYHVLGIIHIHWPPVNERFKDYIAKPKSNRYQSLHTTIIFEKKPLEVQIRTKKMDEIAEYGVAAHWYYKHNFSTQTNVKMNLSWIEKLKELNRLEDDPIRFYEAIKNDLLKEEIYVFTPHGDVIELTRGATPIDFAYHIHTEVGHSCVGAKINGNIITLKTELTNGQTVEIITNKNSYPKRNWLSLVKSSKTKQKIRQWLTKFEKSQQTNQGSEESSKESAKAKAEKSESKTSLIEEEDVDSIPIPVHDSNRIQILVGGEKNVLIRYAQCCNPMPGERIVGFISRGRGISIHKQDCKNLRSISDFENRKVDVSWLIPTNKKIVTYLFRTRKHSNIFSEIRRVTNKFNSKLIKGTIISDNTEKKTQTGLLSIEVGSQKDMARLLKNLKSIPSLINIEISKNSL